MADADVQVSIGVKDAGVEKEIKKLNKSVRDFGKQTQKSLKGVGSSFNVFKGVVAGGAVLGALNTLKNAAVGAFGAIVDKAKDMEQLETQFKTLTGSTENAKKMLMDLQNFAASTPFQLPGIADAASKLIAFGVAQDQIIPKLQFLGDVAAASGSSLNEIALIFGQVSAAGKLTGERLLQLQERAIPIGPALAETMGVAESAVRDLVSKGKVDFATFEKAMQSLNKEGGFAFQGMIAQSKTLGGVLSTLSDNFDLVLNDIGQQFLPLLKQAATAVLTLVQNNREAILSFAQMAASKVTEFLPVAINFFKEMYELTQVLGGSSENLVRVWDRMKAALETLLNFFLFIPRSIRDIIQTYGDWDNMQKKLASNAIGVVVPALKTIGKSASFIVGIFNEDMAASLDKQIEKLERMQDAIDIAAGKAVPLSNLGVAPTQGGQADPTGPSEARTEKKKEALAAEQAALTEMKVAHHESELARKMEQQDLEFSLEEQHQINMLQKEGKFQESKAKMDELYNKKKMAREQKMKDESFKSMTAVVKWQNLSDKQRLANVDNTAKSLARLKDSENKKMAALGKAAAIVSIGIDTARGAIAAYTSLAGIPIVGPILGGIAAAALTAYGLEQMSKVKSTNYATGGFVGGANFTGDRQQVNVNSGEAILNPEQQRRFMELATGQGEGGATSVVVNVEGGLFANNPEQVDEMIDAIKDRIDFGNARSLA